MGHDHPTVLCDQALDRRLWFAVGLNALITAGEVIGGILSGSLALLSDAAHNFGDVAAIALAIWTRRLSRRPPTVRHTFGLHRTEVVAALANAVSLIAVTALIAREAIERLLHPEPVVQGIMLAVALVALAANVASMLLLRRHDHRDVNMRGAFLHMAQDALASVAVVVAALFARTAAGPYVDCAAALLVGLVVLRGALLLVRETLSTILEGVPPDLDIVQLAERVGAAFAPARLHHVHVWEIGPRQRLLTAHVTLGAAMDGHGIEALLARIKALLHEEWGIDHATIEPEVGECDNPDVLGRCQDTGEPPR
jgi:cobalt-zinc-cadmium efflux system protein